MYLTLKRTCQCTTSPQKRSWIRRLSCSDLLVLDHREAALTIGSGLDRGFVRRTAIKYKYLISSFYSFQSLDLLLYSIPIFVQKSILPSLGIEPGIAPLKQFEAVTLVDFGLPNFSPFFCTQIFLIKIGWVRLERIWEVVVWLSCGVVASIPEVRGSNPVIDKNLFILDTSLGYPALPGMIQNRY